MTARRDPAARSPRRLHLDRHRRRHRRRRPRPHKVGRVARNQSRHLGQRTRSLKPASCAITPAGLASMLQPGTSRTARGTGRPAAPDFGLRIVEEVIRARSAQARFSRRHLVARIQREHEIARELFIAFGGGLRPRRRRSSLGIRERRLQGDPALSPCSRSERPAERRAATGFGGPRRRRHALEPGARNRILSAGARSASVLLLS